MVLHRFALVTLVLVMGAVQAKDKKPGLDITKFIEIRLNEGTKVQGTLLTDKLEIETSYGKLQVPIVEIRRIEMGVRPDPKTKAAIDKAVKQLASPEFKDRGDALTQLVNMGELAYGPLQAASKDKDPEVAKLARNGVERIREKYSEEKLAKLKEDDVIVTDRFTICGRVQNPTIKIKGDDGEKEIKPSNMRAVRWVGRSADLELKVEAEKFARNNQWMDAKIEIQEGDEVEIRADGQIDLNGAGQFVCGPKGMEMWKAKAGGRKMILPGALMGKIGKNGTPFEVGEKLKLDGKHTGRLYLNIGSPQNFIGQEGASTGSFKVKITGGQEAD